ncbi:MAG: MFS transporter [Paracoccaceae bacterium]
MTATQSPEVSSPASDALARRNVFVLVLAQAFLGAQMPMIFTVAGLAGASLAPDPAWATLPVTASVLGSMLTATPMSALMARAGRRAGFVTGALAGALGAAIAAWGLNTHSFWLFVLGALFTGVYMSAQGFYRFAAADTASPAFRPKAISWVMAGGLFSALFGPQLVKLTAPSMGVYFLGTYVGVMAINLIGMLLFFALKIPAPPPRATDAPAGRTRMELLRTPRIAVAITCATVSYALMNLVMTSTPLAMIGCGFQTGDAANVVSAHVVAMFAPSFVTGTIIARFGVERVVTLGLLILTGAGAVAMSGVEIGHFFGALMLLGVGWNFGFIGATAMLTQAYRPEEKARVQGLNDLIMFGGVTVASLASGFMIHAGGTAQGGWQMVNLTMLPFLIAAGGALIWLRLRPAAMEVR